MKDILDREIIIGDWVASAKTSGRNRNPELTEGVVEKIHDEYCLTLRSKEGVKAYVTCADRCINLTKIYYAGLAMGGAGVVG